jgi:SAM-dependent methyltransferase
LQRKSFLELGCGSGNVIGYLWEKGLTNSTGWELNSHALQLAERRYPAIKFERKDFLQEESENCYDILGLFDLLEHIGDDVQALKTIRKLINPAGRIVITVPAHQWLWSKYDDFYGHFRRYSKSQMTLSLKKAGYKNIHCSYFMASLVPALWLSRRRIAHEQNDFNNKMNDLFRKHSGIPPAPINSLAKSVLSLEQKFLGLNDIGFGSSLIATATV